MIPCHICGKEASTGWIKGFVPAPDSQKLALCAEHDNLENRALVSEAWNERHKQEISSMTSVARHKAAPFLQVVAVHFTGGGMLSFVCTSCKPAGQETLRIDDADGNHTFIPLRHVREYSLRPYSESPAVPDVRAGEASALTLDSRTGEAYGTHGERALDDRTDEALELHHELTSDARIDEAQDTRDEPAPGARSDEVHDTHQEQAEAESASTSAPAIPLF